MELSTCFFERMVKNEKGENRAGDKASIRVWSRDSGLTQTEIGDIIGVSNPTVNSWINGKILSIRPEHREKLFPYIRDLLGKETSPTVKLHRKTRMRHLYRRFRELPMRPLQWEITGPAFYGRSSLPGNCLPMKKSSSSRSLRISFF